MTNEDLSALIQAGEDVTGNLQRLYDQNIGLIRRCARPFTGKAELEDLQQEAFFSVEAAARHYDPQTGVPWSNYFARILKRDLQRYVSGAIRQPEHQKATNARCRKVSADMEQRTGRAAADAVIMALAGVDAEGVRAYRRSETLEKCASLSAPISDDMELSDVIPDADFSDDLIEEVDRQRLCEEVRHRLDDLPDEERDAIELTILDGYTDKAAAETMRTTAATVRRRREQGIGRLTRCRRLRQLADSYVYTSGSAYHGSLKSYRISMESSVERSAIKHLEQREAAEKAERLYDEIMDALGAI